MTEPVQSGPDDQTGDQPAVGAAPEDVFTPEELRTMPAGLI
ncbi:MAG TPA: hypothetical protein VLI05_05340 [Candidatus Saccharimonadia bacterium]|nr:hypothetical protein [Candidatus Saccharimonadia bacterium]